MYSSQILSYPNKPYINGIVFKNIHILYIVDIFLYYINIHINNLQKSPYISKKLLLRLVLWSRVRINFNTDFPHWHRQKIAVYEMYNQFLSANCSSTLFSEYKSDQTKDYYKVTNHSNASNWKYNEFYVRYLSCCSTSFQGPLGNVDGWAEEATLVSVISSFMLPTLF